MREGEQVGIDEIYTIFPKKIKTIFEGANIPYEGLEEIRIRYLRPIMIKIFGTEYFITERGRITKKYVEGIVASQDIINELVTYVSNYSLYAYEEDIRNGYITIKGGHRIGLCGKVVSENEKIKTMKNISYVNIRVAHQIKGCADRVMPYIISRKKGELMHTLIISAPGCGKTTLLRDIIRQVSDGSSYADGMCVGVVDERSELGACYMGMAQNDLGIRTDILDCCPKSKGMMLLVRSMAPKVIAVDEIGSIDDVNALEYIINCGCKILATVHGTSVDDVLHKPVLGKLVRERIFERYILLDSIRHAGHIKGIFDDRGTCLYAACQVS